jgi:hypothetical protein
MNRSDSPIQSSKVSCPHTDQPLGGQVCVHLLEEKINGYYTLFTGQGKEFQIICSECAKQFQTDNRVKIQTIKACKKCFDRANDEGFEVGILGQPQTLERKTNLHFVHDKIIPLCLENLDVLDIQAITASNSNQWVVLSKKSLFHLDLDQNKLREVTRIDGSLLNPKQIPTLHLAPNGDFAAIVNAKGQYGIVIDLQTKQVTMKLDRGNYHEYVSDYSVAFFKYQGRTLLVHATHWNRLDISDPRTGHLLTDRPSPIWAKENPNPEHYLDYFHSSLLISPDHEWIADWGWVWQPYGVIRIWNLRRWLEENIWGSEDDISTRMFCWREYYWDGPWCWINPTTLAVWGYGDDDHKLIPAVIKYDAKSGDEVQWFGGVVCEKETTTKKPENGVIHLPTSHTRSLFYDQYLLASHYKHGISVWDPDTGERLHADPSFCPTVYHPGAHQFLTLFADGSFRLSRLVDGGEPSANENADTRM